MWVTLGSCSTAWEPAHWPLTFHTHGPGEGVASPFCRCPFHFVQSEGASCQSVFLSLGIGFSSFVGDSDHQGDELPRG